MINRLADDGSRSQTCSSASQTSVAVAAHFTHNRGYHACGMFSSARAMMTKRKTLIIRKGKTSSATITAMSCGGILEQPHEHKCHIAFIHQIYYQFIEFEGTRMCFLSLFRFCWFIQFNAIKSLPAICSFSLIEWNVDVVQIND